MCGGGWASLAGFACVSVCDVIALASSEGEGKTTFDNTANSIGKVDVRSGKARTQKTQIQDRKQPRALYLKEIAFAIANDNQTKSKIPLAKQKPANHKPPK